MGEQTIRCNWRSWARGRRRRRRPGAISIARHSTQLEKRRPSVSLLATRRNAANRFSYRTRARGAQRAACATTTPTGGLMRLQFVFLPKLDSPAARSAHVARGQVGPAERLRKRARLLD